MSVLLPKSTVWQPRNTVHIYASTSCLLRGFVFGTECTDLQVYEIAHYAASIMKKLVYLYFQQIHCRHPAEPALLPCLAVCFGGSSQKVL